MRTDYDYYLIGCRFWEVKPLSPWRFRVVYSKYWQVQRQATDPVCAPKRQTKVVRRWHWLRSIADLIRQGKEVAARAGRFSDEEGDPGSAGAGDREPRVPLTPVLCGCGARPLPSRDADPFIERQW